MNGEKKNICACPSCQSRYRVTEGLQGKIVSCKKCGTKFELSLEAAGSQEESSQKVSHTAFDLTVSEDKLEVYICPKGKVPDGISLESIKELLEIDGINYGIVDDTLISEYLENRPIETKPWKIAEGNAPEPPRDAEVKYYFDTNPSKIGTVKEGGSIDFKDRGELPQVKKGDLLAEKISSIDGTGGTDVFGKIIPARKAKDTRLACGSGAEASEDKLKVFARIDGRPEISFDGKVVVLPELEISGDVGLETGHIRFDGNIKVFGSVQDGFRVRGRRLSAGEILKAKIDVAGDIIVSGGIIGASIKTGGNIRARYIRTSNIEASGDIVVEKEVFDSKIESNGACLVKRGTIYSSWISAKKGIEAYEIGTDVSNPCTLLIGLGKSTRNEVDRIEEQIQRWKEEQKKHETLVDELRQEFDRIEEELGELTQVQDRAMQQHRAMAEKMEKLRKANDRAELGKTEKMINDLESKIKHIEGNLNKPIDKQNQTVEIITGLQNEIKNCEREIKKLHNEIEALTEQSRREKGRSVVKVHGSIFSHTLIRGPHSSIILREDFEHVSIRETRISSPDSQVIWDMNVSRLN